MALDLSRGLVGGIRSFSVTLAVQGPCVVCLGVALLVASRLERIDHGVWSMVAETVMVSPGRVVNCLPLRVIVSAGFRSSSGLSSSPACVVAVEIQLRMSVSLSLACIRSSLLICIYGSALVSRWLVSSSRSLVIAPSVSPVMTVAAAMASR